MDEYPNSGKAEEGQIGNGSELVCWYSWLADVPSLPGARGGLRRYELPAHTCLLYMKKDKEIIEWNHKIVLLENTLRSSSPTTS